MNRPAPAWLAFAPELTAHLGRLLDGDEDEVADVLQTVWLRAWVHLEEARADGVPERPWLFRVATNAALDRIGHRRRWKGRREELASELDRGVDPAPLPLSERTRRRVRAALSELPPKQRDAVWFRWVEGFEYEEVAQRLECSRQSARANVYQGLKRLRRTLADLAEESV